MRRVLYHIADEWEGWRITLLAILLIGAALWLAFIAVTGGTLG